MVNETIVIAVYMYSMGMAIIYSSSGIDKYY